MTIERGSAGGGPSDHSLIPDLACSSSPAALTASPISGRTRASSFLLKALYLFQSLGFDLLPWLLGFFLPRVVVFQLLSPAQIESRTPLGDRRERRGYATLSWRDDAPKKRIERVKREKIHREVKSRSTII